MENSIICFGYQSSLEAVYLLEQCSELLKVLVTLDGVFIWDASFFLFVPLFFWELFNAQQTIHIEFKRKIGNAQSQPSAECGECSKLKLRMWNFILCRRLGRRWRGPRYKFSDFSRFLIELPQMYVLSVLCVASGVCPTFCVDAFVKYVEAGIFPNQLPFCSKLLV